MAYISASKLRDMWLTLELSPEQRELVQSMHSWGEQAACKGSPLFTLDMYGLPVAERKDVERACRDICSICPVIQQCYDHAMRYPEVGGWWGGLSQEQRRAVRKQRRTDDRNQRRDSSGKFCGVRGDQPVGTGSSHRS